MKLIYLSAPYTTGPDTPEKRQSDIDNAAAWLMKNTDVYIFSPISYEQPLKNVYGGWFFPGDQQSEWEFWKPRDAEMVSRCDELWVLCLNNWEASRGVTYEVGLARKLNKPIWYVRVTGHRGHHPQEDTIPYSLKTTEGGRG